MDLLAKRYPRYADKISSSASEDGFPVRGRRPRDHFRRATVVTYNPSHNRSMEYDDSGTMSDIEGPTFSFQRGGHLRSSMPIVRSPPNTFEKPLGLVFLVYNDETKKAVLPNEITHLDTVRAMFVRSFPGKLSMEYMGSPRIRIYILDPRTSIYYQLEDLRDIKDHTVLRLHECNSNQPQKVHKKPEVRGRSVQRADIHQAYTHEAPANAITTQVMKTQSLPPNILRAYPPPPVAYMDDTDICRMRSQAPNLARYASPVEVHDSDVDRPRSVTPTVMARSYPPPLIDRDMEPERGRSQTPEPRKPSRPQNLNYGPKGSPDRMTTPDRQALHSIPENRQIPGSTNTYSNYENIVGFQPYRVAGPNNHLHYPPQSMHLMSQPRSLSPPTRRPMSPPMQQPSRRAFSPPAVPTHSNYQYMPPPVPPQTYIAKSVRAATGISPQHAVPPVDQQAVPPSRNSLPFVPHHQHPEGRPAVLRTQSYRVTPERDAVVLNQRPRSVTPQPMDFETKTRIDKMEVQLANLAHFVQTSVKKPHPSSGYGSGSGKPSSGQSSSSVASNSTGTFPSSTASSTLKKRKVSPNSGLSDIASDTTQQTVKQDIKTTISTLKGHADGLKKDLKNIRRIQQINNETMQEQFQECFKKIQHALVTVPGAEQQPLRQRRSEVNCQRYNHHEEFSRIDKELSDLEASVEELRSDVINRQCRVNQTDVEGLALVLSHVTKCLGEMKAKFPTLQDEMKSVMSGEMEIVVQEEKFLKEEPEKLENSLKRCKKLTGTLFTLKRLSSVQEHRPPQVPNMKPLNRDVGDADKKTLLSNIQSLVPNHSARLESIKAADASRERKKKITTQQESLKFGRSLEIASKALKPSTNDKDPSGTGNIKPIPSQKPSLPGQVSRPTIPLTNTVGKISNIGQGSIESGSTNVALVQSGPTVTAPVSLKASTVLNVQSVDNNNKDNEYVKKTPEKKIENVIPASENRIDNVITSPESNIEDKENSESTDGENDKSLTDQKTAARAAFFSSLASPSSPSNDRQSAFTSPTRTSARTTSSPTKSQSFAARYNFQSNPPESKSGQTSNIPTFGSSKPSSLVFPSSSSRTKEGSLSPQRPSAGALIRSQSSASAIPRYQTCTESVKKKMSPPVNYESKPKRVPPPPPPRKSSKITIQGPASPSSSSVNGSVISPVRPTTPLGSETSTQHQKPCNLSVDTSVCSSNIPMSSTPKTDGSQKPLTVFEKGLVQGLYSNLKRHVAVQEKGEVGKIEVVTTDLNSDKNVMAREEREGSSDSSTSSSSLDSQQGAVWVKRESTNGDISNKKNRPTPPERKSSLISKSQTETSSSVNGDIKSKQTSPSKDLPVS